LIEACVFHQPGSEWKPPAPQSITALVAAHPGMSDLTTVGAQVISDNTSVKLDFGAIAKGYAVAAGLLKLRHDGVTAAMINAGGDLGVIGEAAENQPWRAAIQDPFAENTIAKIDLNDGEFLATSGNYERFHRYQGKKYTHLINPLSGEPENFWASVSVLAHDGSLADAAATALSLTDKTSWQHMAQNLAVDQVMLIDAQGGVYLTPAMRKRLQFTDIRP